MEESNARQALRGSGDRVPEVTFRLRRGGQWVEKPSIALFGGRRVVVFAVPAAFSTSCSARHLPGYVALARNIERSEEHTSELQSLMRISYAVFCLKKKKTNEHAVNCRP